MNIKYEVLNCYLMPRNNKQSERGSPTMACYQTNRPMSFWKDKLKLVSDVRSDTSK